MQWRTPPSSLRLKPGEVHVWRASLTLDRDATSQAWGLLSPEERRRALRMRFPLHRARTVASRGILRTLLGRYLDIAPQAVPIVVEPSGRPSLDDAASPRLTFSVSHAGPVVLLAIAADRAVGVDVERLRREVPFEQLAARFFAVSEARALNALPRSLLPAAFFACWTRKEALFKAWGGEGGLVPSLKRFTVPVAPRLDPITVTATRDSGRWELTTLDPGPGFAAALALEVPAVTTCFVFDWPA
jgi:4'-phosphopantetheinyl transferase